MKQLKYSEIPDEVMWAMIIGFPHGNVRLVGVSTLEKIREIQKKYPEWFPWETLYDSIPQEVHDAYRNEAYPDWDKPIEFSGKGVLDSLKEKAPVYTGEVDPNWLDNLLTGINKQNDAAFEEDLRLSRIWNKHYSKYKLKYRK